MVIKQAKLCDRKPFKNSLLWKFHASFQILNGNSLSKNLATCSVCRHVLSRLKTFHLGYTLGMCSGLSLELFIEDNPQI